MFDGYFVVRGNAFENATERASTDGIVIWDDLVMFSVPVGCDTNVRTLLPGYGIPEFA